MRHAKLSHCVGLVVTSLALGAPRALSQVKSNISLATAWGLPNDVILEGAAPPAEREPVNSNLIQSQVAVSPFNQAKWGTFISATGQVDWLTHFTFENRGE